MADRLSSGERLGVGESLASPGGQYSLVVQDDGNLVLYDQDGQAVWAAGTDGREVASATMQDDGNLVLYSANNEAVWASDTYGNERAYLVVQDDRNVVIYSADGTSIWATNTTA
jgi:outer membrane protein assembly factor BamB